MNSFTESGTPEVPTALSRRDFLRGSAAVGAIAVGSSVLAGCAPKVDDAEAVNAPALPEAEPITPVAPPAEWTAEADVVVVGVGGGGLAASLLAAQKGASVIALDLSPESSVGGSTKESSYFMCLGGSRFQNENGIPFDPAALFAGYWPYFRNSVDPELMMTMIVRGHETIDWLEELGVPWDFDWTFTGRGGTGLCWKGADDDGLTVRMTKKVVDFVYPIAVETGVQFMFDTKVTALVQDGERIVGVKAQTADGDIYIKGSKGVILTAGGCANNRDMLKKYIPTCDQACGSSMMNPSDVGDAIRMGIGVGAQTKGFDSFGIFDGGPDWESFENWSQYLYSGYTALIRSPWLQINEQGRRFTYLDNNGVGGEMMATFHGMIEMAQPGNRGYVIFDKGWEARVPAFGQSGCRRPITPDMKDVDRMPETIAPHNWVDGANRAIENGWIRQADTIEELAEKMGLNPTVVKQAVDDWNATCEAGADNPLYAYKPEWLIPIKEAPFFGASVGGFCGGTGFGLAVNPAMQVMSTEGTPIPGLYAGFTTAGGAWGESGYGFASVLAINHLSWWSGYIAAETVLAS